MKSLVALFILFSLQAIATDWDFTTLENCSDYDVESFDIDTDFMIKCVDDEGETVYLEDYFLEQD